MKNIKDFITENAIREGHLTLNDAIEYWWEDYGPASDHANGDKWSVFKSKKQQKEFIEKLAKEEFDSVDDFADSFDIKSDISDQYGYLKSELEGDNTKNIVLSKLADLAKEWLTENK